MDFLQTSNNAKTRPHLKTIAELNPVDQKYKQLYPDSQSSVNMSLKENWTALYFGQSLKSYISETLQTWYVEGQ